MVQGSTPVRVGYAQRHRREDGASDTNTDLLPKAFPPWRAGYKAFRGWAHAGTFEPMHDRRIDHEVALATP